MIEVAQLAWLGLGTGAVYALVSLGVVAIYRGSGVLNFSQGVIVLACAFVFVRLWKDWGMPLGLAMAATVLTGTALGLIIYVIVMRPLAGTPPVVRVVASVGVFTVLFQTILLVFGSAPRQVATYLPTTRWQPVSELVIGADRVVLVLVACAATGFLAAVNRWSRIGIASRAVAENRRGLAALGWSPGVISASAWTVGGALAGVAGVLVVPITGVSADKISMLVIPALAAALLARFTVFSVVLVSALALGAVQATIIQFTVEPGLPDAIPFVVIIAILAIRGSSIPRRDEILDLLPRAARTGPHLWLGVGGAAVLLAAVWLGSTGLAVAVTTSLLFALVGLSVVMLTGYAGQLSLGQFAIAGIGGFTAARVGAATGWPFLVDVLIGAAVASVAGLVFALPSLRTRSVSLAVITLSTGVAVQQVLFANPRFTGRSLGIKVDPPSVFGWKIDEVFHPRSYATVAVTAFVLVAFAVANIRSSSVGRKMLAVRANERAASSLGVRVAVVKFYAFGVAAAIAGLAGALIALRTQTLFLSPFNVLASLNVVVLTAFGGIGFIGGSVVAGASVPGGVLNFLARDVGNIERYLVIAGGVGLLVTLIKHPDGIVSSIRVFDAERRRKPAVFGESSSVEPAMPRSLHVRHLHVSFGAVVAVDDVSLTVRPGRVLGLLGANGAGKTTLIDAISGYVSASGEVLVDDRPVTKLSAARRAQLGIGRSFQSLELFDDLTVAENLAVGAERGRWTQWFSAALRPHRTMPGAVLAVAEEFGIVAELDRYPPELPYATRRVVAVARAVAARPSILLLDEPCSGLDERSTDRLASALRTLVEKWQMTVLLVEHDVGFLTTLSDDVVALDFGRLIFSGTPEAAVHNEDVIAAYLGDDSITDDDLATADRP